VELSVAFPFNQPAVGAQFNLSMAVPLRPALGRNGR